jgi:Toxin co-regulated pilus biosynthesis protein Q
MKNLPHEHEATLENNDVRPDSLRPHALALLLCKRARGGLSSPRPSRLAYRGLILGCLALSACQTGELEGIFLKPIKVNSSSNCEIPALGEDFPSVGTYCTVEVSNQNWLGDDSKSDSASLGAQNWDGKAGETVYEVISRWAESEGYSVISWHGPHYPVRADFAYEAVDLEGALNLLRDDLARYIQPPPAIQVNTGNKKIVVDGGAG